MVGMVLASDDWVCIVIYAAFSVYPFTIVRVKLVVVTSWQVRVCVIR